MFKIVEKTPLSAAATRMTFEVPLAAKKAQAGQFVILRVDEEGERIPLTVAGYDREKGTISVIYQVVGATTKKLDNLDAGDYIKDFTGPLGNPTEIETGKKVAIIGGGVGCAISFLVAKEFYDAGNTVHSIIGFRSKDLVILEDEFKANSSEVFVGTDDGSYGRKGMVTDTLRELIERGEKYDLVIAIGPIIMMKFVCKLTEEFNIPTIVSMNPIMIDGTGMCGGCRLTVGGEMKFACVDGPDFDGHLVDFDETMNRNTLYKDFEKHAYDEACNLLNKEVAN